MTSHLRRVRALLTLAVCLLLGIVLLAACTSSSAQSSVDAGNQVAQTEYTLFNAAVPYPFARTAPSDPLERKNLAARLVQYNAAGNTNYVYVFAWGSAQPIGYYAIRGKVSSTGSQMTSTQQITNCAGDHGGSCSAVEAIGDDGSYGPNEGGQNGVFFFTTAGTLIETDQPFMVSSAPIKLFAAVPQLDAAAK